LASTGKEEEIKEENPSDDANDAAASASEFSVSGDQLTSRNHQSVKNLPLLKSDLV